jgi:LuxR family transcriptional regulator, regulator of acetate metabolism
VVARRPLSVPDYRNATLITHDYDEPVAAEGIRSILAVPVVVDGSTRAVLYGAYRRSAPIGDGVATALVSSARRLSQELAIRDEVDRRLRLREAQAAQLAAAPASPEQIREVHAELRRLATEAPPELGRQLRRLADLLTSDHSAGAVPLTARELDVLAQVALGCTNKEAAQRLSLKPETVKSYLRSAAAKLGTSTRHEAVSRARRARLIP